MSLCYQSIDLLKFYYKKLQATLSLHDSLVIVSITFTCLFSLILVTSIFITRLEKWRAVCVPYELLKSVSEKKYMSF